MIEEIIKEHPVITELKEKINSCRQQLLGLLSDWHYMLNIVQPRLMFTYETLFGDLEIEVHRKSKIAAQLDRRVELLSYRLKKGETLNPHVVEFVERVVKNEFNKEDKIKFSSNDSQYHSINNNSTNYYKYDNSNNKQDLPHLYRTIVKKLHPDIAGESEDFKKYWESVQEAYKTANYHRLKLFHKTLCADENKDFSDISSEELALRNEIFELQQNIILEKKRIDKLLNQEPFIFEDKFDDSLWVARRKRKLKERLFQLDRQIRYNQRLLRSLTGKDFSNVENFYVEEMN